MPSAKFVVQVAAISLITTVIASRYLPQLAGR